MWDESDSTHSDELGRSHIHDHMSSMLLLFMVRVLGFGGRRECGEVDAVVGLVLKRERVMVELPPWKQTGTKCEEEASGLHVRSSGYLRLILIFRVFRIGCIKYFGSTSFSLLLLFFVLNCLHANKQLRTWGRGILV